MKKETNIKDNKKFIESRLFEFMFMVDQLAIAWIIYKLITMSIS